MEVWSVFQSVIRAMSLYPPHPLEKQENQRQSCTANPVNVYYNKYGMLSFKYVLKLLHVIFLIPAETNEAVKL